MGLILELGGHSIDEFPQREGSTVFADSTGDMDGADVAVSSIHSHCVAICGFLAVGGVAFGPLLQDTLAASHGVVASGGAHRHVGRFVHA